MTHISGLNVPKQVDIFKAMFQGFSIMSLESEKLKRLTKTYVTENDSLAYNVALNVDKAGNVISFNLYGMEMKKGIVGSFTPLESLPEQVEKLLKADLEMIKGEK